VSDWSGLFLGTIAVATLVMAVMQVGAVVAVLRIARQAQDVLTSVQRDVKPLIAKAGQIADDAGRTAALATAQAQKVDTLVTNLARRVDETSALVQQAIVLPAREGMAIVAALKAALSAFKGFGDFRGRTARHAEEEDALFIG
jgi:hypothetical protein